MTSTGLVPGAPTRLVTPPLHYRARPRFPQQLSPGHLQDAESNVLRLTDSHSLVQTVH